jgi:hypothetical protein
MSAWVTFNNGRIANIEGANVVVVASIWRRRKHAIGTKVI